MKIPAWLFRVDSQTEAKVGRVSRKEYREGITLVNSSAGPDLYLGGSPHLIPDSYRVYVETGKGKELFEVTKEDYAFVVEGVEYLVFIQHHIPKILGLDLPIFGWVSKIDFHTEA